MAASPPIDLLDSAFYLDGARDAYRWMRRHEPVYRDEASGLWGIASHEGVRAIGADTAVFSSAQGSRPESGPVPWMMDMDAPDHIKRRKLVNRAFTPMRVRDSEARIRAICDDLVDAVCERGECDFRHDLAAPLPLVVICDMLGIPPGDRDAVLHWSDVLLDSLQGGEEALQAAARALTEWSEYARRLIEARRADPADDLVTVLVHAEVDGERLEPDELVFEVLLLLLGGDETTRNVACGGMEQLVAHPGERQRLFDDLSLLPSGVEEMLRWVSPIKNMSRTVTRDVELGGRALRAGDKVVLLYESANFDEAVFDDADRFDVGRAPNDHVAFGFGAHFCLGASLARLELVTMFERLLARLPDLELATSEPPPRSIVGISSMPVRFTPSGRSSAEGTAR